MLQYFLASTYNKDQESIIHSERESLISKEFFGNDFIIETQSGLIKVPKSEMITVHYLKSDGTPCGIYLSPHLLKDYLGKMVENIASASTCISLGTGESGGKAIKN